MYRVTIMPALINQARMVVFLVSGDAKASVLKEVFTEPEEPFRLPVQLVRPRTGELIWLVDKAAAAQLDPS
jgi:6-phosphogluconolactonase